MLTVVPRLERSSDATDGERARRRFLLEHDDVRSYFGEKDEMLPDDGLRDGASEEVEIVL